MSDPHAHYQSPFEGRYASEAMLTLFGDNMRYQTWRRLWVALAETEAELGLPVSKSQIEELKAHIADIDYEVVRAKEKEIRHDVMAHVYAYGQVCPHAAGIIHLGATSCYVTDNADILILREALRLTQKKLALAIRRLSAFADRYKAQPTLGYTHLQPAQLVTVGKRATLWIQDLCMDMADLEHMLGQLRLLGSRGTTGTQASFLALFEGDHEKVKALDRRVAERMGFTSDQVFSVSGQTYPRKLDSRILNVLSGIAQSAHRFATDLRLLQHMREVEEPFERGQVGSSAMAYKRNPMRSERICSLARYVISDALNPAFTASTQWMERTLDDSANRRISLPEGFLAVDAILNLIINVADGCVVYPKIIERRVREFLPFIATENILMAAVRAGGDRQALHERIRQHSMAASRRMKEDGLDCDLLDRLAADPAFHLNAEALEQLLNPADYIGRAPEQVDDFLTGEVAALLSRFPEENLDAPVNV